MPPLWMPEGSVRSIIALSIIGAAIYEALFLGSTNLTALAGAVAIFYFEKRAENP